MSRRHHLAELLPHRRPRLSSATPGEVQARDPAASMALIVETIRHPLDPLYEDVAHRRRHDGAKPASWSRTLFLGLVTLLAGLLIGCAIAALRTPTKVGADARGDIIAQIQDKQASNDADLETVREMRTEIDSVQGAALGHAGGGGLRAQLENGQARANLTARSGPGLEVRIDDPPSKGGGSADSDPRTGGSAQHVTSRDLQRIVNGLWQSGASAITVNDQRLTGQSAIRFAGSAVLVNYRPLTTPYVVRALGPESLAASFKATDGGSFLQQLEGKGYPSSATSEGAMTLPAGPPVRLTHAQVDK